MAVAAAEDDAPMDESVLSPPLPGEDASHVEVRAPTPVMVPTVVVKKEDESSADVPDMTPKKSEAPAPNDGSPSSQTTEGKEKVNDANTTPGRRRRQRSESVTTCHEKSFMASESIFRLLPRETRPALRRMLFVEPVMRCTLTDLLKGRGKTSGLLCGCMRRRNHGQNMIASPSRTNEPSESQHTQSSFMDGHCVDHDDHDEEDEDDGDEWINSLEPCSRPGVVPKHIHIKVAVEEKAGKKKFF